MFTGLIDDVGAIVARRLSDAGVELDVACVYEDLVVGESVACNGACLTVREARPRWFSVAAATTTLGRTTIGGWALGDRLNLERALRADSRLGGHFVLGHVDAVGTVVGVGQLGTSRLVDIEIPDRFAPLLIPHGSVAVDGISLTVNALTPRTLQVALVAHTLAVTTVAAWGVGRRVHLEGDVLGKYVLRQLELRASDSAPPAGSPAG